MPTLLSKNGHMGPHQTKRLLHNKSNHRQQKRQRMECEKISVNYFSDKGLISKICKKLLQLSSAENANNQVFKSWAKDLHRHFFK